MVKSAVNYLSNFEAAVVKECQRQNYDGVVCGHIHHAEHSKFGEVDYFNCGDWVESCTALLEDNNGKIVVYRDTEPTSNVTKLKVRRSRSSRSERKIAAASNSRT
jgi:UDP-2,3-diacylglucosamine pyrophosphatase LpxH